MGGETYEVRCMWRPLFRKGMKDMRKAKRKLTDDVNMTFQSAPCACTILILFAYNEVNKKSIFLMFHQLIGRVFIFLHIQFLFVSDKRHLSSGSSPGTF